MTYMIHAEQCESRRHHNKEYCECGALEAQNRLAQLEDEREAIQRLIADAEFIQFESTYSLKYSQKMVLAGDLEDVLAGKLR